MTVGCGDASPLLRFIIRILLHIINIFEIIKLSYGQRLSFPIVGRFSTIHKREEWVGWVCIAAGFYTL